MRSARQGQTVVEYDLDDLDRALARAPGSISARFVTEARAASEAVIAAAAPSWPVRTGRSKAALSVFARTKGESLQVGVQNDARNRWGLYAYKIRFSRYTAETLQRRAMDFAARGNSAASKQAIAEWHLRRRLWPRHGRGAPSAALSGQPVWRSLIRSPIVACVPEIVEALAAGAAEDLGGRP